MIAEQEELPPDRKVDRLLALRLIDRDPYRAGRYVPHDPRAVAQALTAAALRDLTQLADRMAHIPALERLAEHFDPHRLYGGPGSEYLATAHQMNARLGETTVAATAEVITLQPSEPADRDPAILRLGIDRTRAALSRGVHVRSLYHRSTHEHGQSRDYIGQMVADGADVRASSTPGPRMVIIDQRHLFIDNHVIESAEPNSGWHVFDRAAVMWARAVFNHFWDQATRWQDLSRPAGHTAISERQRRILRELDAGYSQQQVGPRIGLSERAVTKELAAIRDSLGYRSMYQVMAWWGRASAAEMSDL